MATRSYHSILHSIAQLFYASDGIGSMLRKSRLLINPVPMPGHLLDTFYFKGGWFLSLQLLQLSRSALTEIIRQGLLPTPHFDAILLQAGRRQDGIPGPLRRTYKSIAGSRANYSL